MADDGKKKVMVDEFDKEISKYEVKNLKIALEAANDALKVERQQKRMDRKTDETKIKRKLRSITMKSSQHLMISTMLNKIKLL